MFKKLNLKNGATLILNPLTETKAVTVLVLFKIGSRYESKKLNGVSHFIEHLLFKGTKKRPSTLAISKELDGVGAEYNAFTAKDHTGYYVKVFHKKFELAIDILSDIIFFSLYNNKEIEREKNVIIEEINMYEDNPLLYIDDFYEQTVFGKSPLGRQISGPKDNIKLFKRKEIIGFRDIFYQPKNMIISVAGRFDEKEILALIEKYFYQENLKKKIPDFKAFEFKQLEPQINIKFQKTEQVQLAFGFPGFSYFHKDLYALYLLLIILGGSMSSRLFISLRERKGLCYFVKASPNVYQDTGTVVIQAGLDKKRIFLAMELIWQELKTIKKEGVKNPEFKKAKDFLKGKLVLELEESSEIASFLGKQFLLTGKIERPEDKFKRISQVKKEDIKRVSRKIFQKNKLNLAVIGPFKAKNDFKDFIDQKLK